MFMGCFVVVSAFSECRNFVGYFPLVSGGNVVLFWLLWYFLISSTGSIVVPEYFAISDFSFGFSVASEYLPCTLGFCLLDWYLQSVDIYILTDPPCCLLGGREPDGPPPGLLGLRPQTSGLLGLLFLGLHKASGRWTWWSWRTLQWSIWIWYKHYKSRRCWEVELCPEGL